MFLSTKTKGILTIIGGFIIHLVHIKKLTLDKWINLFLGEFKYLSY